MHDHLAHHFWGNVIIVVLTGAVTLGCIVAMLRMLIHPGEHDPHHPKHDILKEDG